MNREDIIKLAREAGMALLLEEHAGEYGNGTLENTPYPELERFANLVAAAEREAFAKECDEGYACKGYTNGYAAGYENGYSEGKTAGFDLTLAPKITVIHAKDCWSWGAAHYECACAEIAKLRGWKK
jgi:flagellar biosynthesis/type III secretory pathway protein FliH